MVPVISNFYQRRQFSKGQEDLNLKIASEIGTRLQTVENQLQTRIDETEKTLEKTLLEKQQEEIDLIKSSLEETKKELQVKIGLTTANAFHIQANYSKYAVPKLVSANYAIPLYIKGGDEGNIRSVIAIIKDALKEVKKEEYKITPDIEKTTNEIIDTLKNNNVNGRYNMDISDIEFELKSAKNRKEEPKKT